MVLSWRQRFVLKLRMRYKFKRIYLTFAIPAIIALIIMSYALYTGFAPVPSIGPIQNNASNNVALSKLQEYELLYGNATTVASINKTIHSATPNPHNFDLVLVASLLIGLGPYSADVTMKDRKLRQYEADFTDFLFELSELVRGGIDPIKAITTLSEGNTGSITEGVRMVAKQMEIGYTFEQAMRNLAITLKSPLVDKYVDLVVQASYSGGGVANLIQRASADMGTFLSIEREKRAGLAQYTLILYAAQVILIALSAILVVQFLPDLSQIATIGGSNAASSILGNADIGSVNLERDLFYLVLINGFLGGLVIGKISESKVKHGLKHALILVVVAFIAWSLFVVPAVTGAGQHYDYKVVSYDKTGPTGLPLKDPIVVQVNETSGAPAVSVLVSFSISGPGSTATIVPASSDTDTNGRASAEIILGDVPGIYTVGITVNGNLTEIPINGTSGGQQG
ncbi:MAG: type II secretion system F family protein [Nitrososphaerales archaeon]|jgi:flagellar protein FlaJ